MDKERVEIQLSFNIVNAQVYCDVDTGIWKVMIYTKGVPGEDQSVYLGTNGKLL